MNVLVVVPLRPIIILQQSVNIIIIMINFDLNNQVMYSRLVAPFGFVLISPQKDFMYT